MGGTFWSRLQAVTLHDLFCRPSFDPHELATARECRRGRKRERGREGEGQSFLQEKKKKKCACDKLCYQETTHHYPWARGAVSRDESNRKSTVGKRNGRAWPAESDRTGGWMLERLAKLWLKAIVKIVERK